ncbi:hypothetical protein C0989_010120 [Termitomyces sp. Mn162]|nr:hypothetical protein C0989_010120 [Termitomyces sp. Mn162]
MRSIPSPKPAPSTTLPDVPRQPPSPPPRLPSIAVNPSLGLSLDRASQSAPALLVSPKRDSTSSVVSPTIRKINRSHALARLEGRTNSTRRRSRPIKRNFMSMSDEESEADDDDDDDSPTLPLIDEPEDLVLPSPPLSLSEPRTVPLGPRFPSSVRTRSTSSRKHQSTSKDWFSLKSFIDLQTAEDDSTKFSWRSFIEVARVS